MIKKINISWLVRLRSRRLLRSCVVCERLIFLKIPLCAGCRRQVFKLFREHINDVSYLHGHEGGEDRRIGDPIPVISLWVWDEAWHCVLQRVIVALKDGNNPRLYQLFTRWMDIKLRHLNFKLKGAFVSVPSFDRRHPQCLGWTCARHWQVDYHDILFKRHSRAQKTKGRQERQGVRVHLKNLDYQVPKHWVLLDDTYVTGASARAAADALRPVGSVHCILVWAEKELF